MYGGSTETLDDLVERIHNDYDAYLEWCKNNYATPISVVGKDSFYDHWDLMKKKVAESYDCY